MKGEIMKRKVLLFSVLILSLFILAGCSDGKKVKVLKCSIEKDVTDSIHLESKYNVYYTGKYVNSIKTVESVTAKDKSVLEAYQKQLDVAYKEYRKLDGYDNSIELKGDKLTSKTNIDYTKIDMDELVKIEKSLKNIIKDGKIKVDDIRAIYEDENFGAKCE